MQKNEKESFQILQGPARRVSVDYDRPPRWFVYDMLAVRRQAGCHWHLSHESPQLCNFLSSYQMQLDEVRTFLGIEQEEERIKISIFLLFWQWTNSKKILKSPNWRNYKSFCHKLCRESLNATYEWIEKLKTLENISVVGIVLQYFQNVRRRRSFKTE